MSRAAAAQQNCSVKIPVSDYDLGATLNSGQAFRWTPDGSGWAGVIGSRWVRLEHFRSRELLHVSGAGIIRAQTNVRQETWHWLEHYLQTGTDLQRILGTFPDDEPLRAATQACRGLRLLRQEPWECLASFILSSTKQIVQIRQVVDQLCRRFGNPLDVPVGAPAAWAFPSAERIASLAEADLRGCKMGFRAPYLLATARRVASGETDLPAIPGLPLQEARARLMDLPGVGRKIADCVLLFGLGFHAAFPVDVWVLKALRQLYFPKRRPGPGRLRQFADSHFGPFAGYAQQYLFHYMRTRHSLVSFAP